MGLAFGSPIEAIDCSDQQLPETLFESETPVVLRGLVSRWPVVKAASGSNQAIVDYLLKFYRDKPVGAFLANPEVSGRFFYNESLDGFNFVQSNVMLDDILNKVLEQENLDNSPAYYVGSLEIEDALPGFSQENALPIPYDPVRTGIWLGNQSMVAPHYDFPDNIACCVAGKRRFTLFPPDQISNLYVGPLDLTPAGQQISLVDIREPDLARFPRFKNAMDAALTVLLEPGDAIYVPSMWWHAVESQDSFNALVNYWWRSTPEYMGSPNNPLLHALLGIKDLPERQKRAWQTLFNYYIFEQQDENLAHIPESARGSLGDISDKTARQLRAQLINKLKY